MFSFIASILMAVDIDWSDIIDPIGRMFTGNESIEGIMGGDSILLGVFIFMILLVLTLMFGLGMLVGSVILIPSLFAVFNYVPSLRVVVAIICGLIFGLGLHKFVRR